MTKKVIAVFSSREQAEKAANQLRQEGFDKEISVVVKDEQRQGRGETTMRDDSLVDGTTIGALGGFALGAGALVIPGVGPLLAAGPIASALTGAAAGGLGGALIDLGIPEVESKEYEGDIKAGKALIAVECDENRAKKATQVLQRNGAEKVNEH